jgi:membrane-bound metal-dependent hydrolase YbcI (DUF457 family)
VPVRELFGLAAAAVAFLAQRPLEQNGLALEQRLAVAGGLYLFVRYGLRALFTRLTVHRGMFHSIPALLIAGLVFYLGYHSDQPRLRLFLAGGVMLGFLSHLVLDEIYSVDFMGLRLHLNKYAGSALKLTSKSLPATLATYLLLGLLAYLAWLDWNRSAPGS